MQSAFLLCSRRGSIGVCTGPRGGRQSYEQAVVLQREGLALNQDWNPSRVAVEAMPAIGHP